METTLTTTNLGAVQTSPFFTSISAFISSQITKMENGMVLTDKGVKYSAETIRGYESLRVHFANFEEQSGKELSFSEVGYDFALAFQAYLTTQGLAKNSVSMVMSKFKAILKMAWRKNYCNWNGSGLKTPTERTTQTYLSMEEIKKLRNAELSKTERQIVDAFTVQIFTGLRYDTLTKFLKNPLAYIHEHNGKSYIDIISDKTGEQSLIPVGEVVQGILRTYGGEMRIFTEQYVNRMLKNIARKAGLDKGIVVRRTEGGEMQEKLVDKCDKVSTHTARRTLISLMRIDGFADSEITLVSGHTTTKQMLHYDRSGSFHKVKRLLGNKFFDTEL